MKGRSPGGRLAGSSTAAHNAGLNNADKAKQNWAQGPEGMAGVRAGGGHFMLVPPPIGTSQTSHPPPPPPSPPPQPDPPAAPASPAARLVHTPPQRNRLPATHPNS